MDDLRHRDLSSKPESELTADERLELNRRFEEFVGLLRKKGGIAAETQGQAEDRAPLAAAGQGPPPRLTGPGPLCGPNSTNRYFNDPLFLAKGVQGDHLGRSDFFRRTVGGFGVVVAARLLAVACPPPPGHLPPLLRDRTAIRIAPRGRQRQ